MKTRTLMYLFAMMPFAATGQELPPDMPLPPMKKDERVVKAQQETKTERQKREAAEADARKAKAENDELKRQLAEAKKQAAPADAAKVGRGDAMPVGANAGTTNYAPLSVFRDKLSGGSLGPEMVVIPAGEFDMGSNESGLEMPIHKVRIAKTFALGKTEVTQKQWRQVMGGNPPKLRFKGCDDCPVENVNWNDVNDFIKKLNGMTGKRYRLPSEAEWEYAAKAGENYKYAGNDDYDAVAWHEINSGGKTHPVGQKKPNAWGLYDMSGNVWEWVDDISHDNYQGAPGDGSAWTWGGDNRERVIRSGSWNLRADFARSARRDAYGSWIQDDIVGFRLARELP